MAFKFGRLESVSRFGPHERIFTVPESTPKDSIVHNVAALVAVDGSLHRLVRNFVSDAQAIDADPDLTEKGKRDRLVKKAQAVMEELDKVEKVVLSERVRVLKQRAHERLYPHQRSEVDSFAALWKAQRAEMRQQEIRQRLAAMEPSERFQVFQQALEAGDADTFGAFDNAPPVYALLNDKVLSEGRRLWSERANPEVAAEFRLLSDAETALASSITTIRESVRETAGLEDDAATRIRAVGAAKAGAA